MGNSCYPCNPNMSQIGRSLSQIEDRLKKEKQSSEARFHDNQQQFALKKAHEKGEYFPSNKQRKQERNLIEEASFPTEENNNQKQFNANSAKKSKQQEKYELNLRQKKFLTDIKMQQLLHGSNDLQIILTTACKAHQMKLHQQAAKLFKRFLQLYQKSSQTSQSNLTLSEGKIFVYEQLIQIAILQKRNEEAKKMFEACLKLYQSMPEQDFIDRKITMMNNYGVLCWETSHLSEAIQIYKQTYELQCKYYTKIDERRFVTLVNLACIYHYSGQSYKAQQLLKQVQQTCKDIRIKQLAGQNQRFIKRAKSQQA